MSADVHPFGGLLRQLRIRIGLSQNQLARKAGVDPAYVNRLERAPASSTSLPSRKVVLALAGTVEATPLDREHLLIAAGHCPATIAELEPSTLDVVMRLLVDDEALKALLVLRSWS